MATIILDEGTKLRLENLFKKELLNPEISDNELQDLYKMSNKFGLLEMADEIETTMRIEGIVPESLNPMHEMFKKLGESYISK